MTRTREADTGQAFAEAVRSFAPERPPLVLGHFDADGLASIALLARALERGGRPAEIRIVGKGETVWSEAMRAELAKRRPGGLVVADLGVREGPVLAGVPTVLVDHHVPTGTPGDALVLSGNGLDPEPTSALIAYWCAQGLGPADDLLWLAAIGLIGDMADAADFPELEAAQARYGKTALRNAVALINAPRRTAAADAGPALALLLACDSRRNCCRARVPKPLCFMPRSRKSPAHWKAPAG